MKEARKTTCKLNSWRSVNICFRGKIFNKEGGDTILNKEMVLFRLVTCVQSNIQ